MIHLHWICWQKKEFLHYEGLEKILQYKLSSGFDVPFCFPFVSILQVKRRNMERLTLCCGGNALNSVYDLSEDDLGYAGEV